MKPETELYLREVFAELRGMKGPWTYRIFSSGPTPVYEVWDYLNDERQKLPPLTLDEVHEAEKCLSHDQWRIYLGFVMGERTIPRLASMEEFHTAWMATAHQRAEAIARVLGKWKE